MGFPDWFLFDAALPTVPQIVQGMSTLGRILWHLAALIGLLIG